MNKVIKAPIAKEQKGMIALILGRINKLIRSIYWRYKLAYFGKGSFIHHPTYIIGGKSISIGPSVYIWHDARIESLDDNKQCVFIGEGSVIQPYVHLGAIDSIIIGKYCLFASYVYITDHDHDYADPFNPPCTNGNLVVAPVVIGDYVWLGEKVIVLKGVTIGERSIIGAGSIVTHDIPPFSIAVGSPAKVIKQWNHQKQCWEKVI